jgi:hypothetical protein
MLSAITGPRYDQGIVLLSNGKIRVDGAAEFPFGASYPDEILLDVRRHS